MLAARWATAGDSMSSTWLSTVLPRPAPADTGTVTLALPRVGFPRLQRVPDGCHHARKRKRDNHDAVAAHGTEHGRLGPGRFDAGILHQLTFTFPLHWVRPRGTIKPLAQERRTGGRDTTNALWGSDRRSPRVSRKRPANFPTRYPSTAYEWPGGLGMYQGYPVATPVLAGLDSAAARV